MKNARLFHALGAWVLILMGLTHLVARIHFERTEHTPEQARVLDAMQATPLGPHTAVTLADVLTGMSWSFTLFSVLIGALALIVGRRMAERPEVLQPVRIVLVAFLAGETAISVLYFIPAPTVFLSVATLAFLISVIAARRGAARA